MSANTATVIVTALSLFVTIALAVIGYIIKNLTTQIQQANTASKERHDSLAREIERSEARLRIEIRDNEARVDKGDERVLAHVNSQFSEVNTQLREMRDDIKSLVKGKA